MSTINKNAGRIIATVVSNKRVGQYHQILLNVGEMVSNCKPGNFVAMKVGGENAKMILRRAFAISRVSLTGPYGGSMELIVAPFGQGSKWLCSQIEGAEIDLIAPLGTAFGIPTQPVRALLVGGGYGSAPLFGLAEVLRDNTAQTMMPAVVADKHLEKANGRMWSAESLTNSFIGPPLGSLIISVAIFLPFFIDAATFFIAAAIFATQNQRRA